MPAKIRIVPAKLVEFSGVVPRELRGAMWWPTVVVGVGGGDEAATSNFPLKKGEETLEIAKKNIILTPTLTLIFRNLILV